MEKGKDITVNTSLIRKVTLASMLGTIFDYYDFFITGTAAASVWPAVFFPTSTFATAVLLSFSVYGIGFFSRPIGSYLFGHFGDKRGRKEILVLTLILAGLSTLGMGLTPSYYTLGLIAPIILTIFRFIQGIGLGGEWGGATTWITEVAAKGRRGFWAGFVPLSVFIGLLLADITLLGLQSFFPRDFYLSIGWRIAFIIGTIIVLIGAIIRFRLSESPLFVRIVESKMIERAPANKVLKEYWRKILLLAGSVMYITAIGYLTQTFSISYLSALKVPPPYTIISVIFSTIGGIITVFLGMYVSDIIGRKKTIIIGQLLVIILGIPIFLMIDTGDFLLSRIAIILGTTIEGFGFAAFGAFMAEQFPTKYRYSGSGLSYQIATPLAGGLAPIIASQLFNIFGTHAGIYIGFEVFAYALIGFTCMLFTKETKGEELK